jgi:hypothetical protein
LKLLQKARKNNIDLVARKHDRSGTVRKFFKHSPDFTHSEEDVDDIQELEHKIK